MRVAFLLLLAIRFRRAPVDAPLLSLAHLILIARSMAWSVVLMAVLGVQHLPIQGKPGMNSSIWASLLAAHGIAQGRSFISSCAICRAISAMAYKAGRNVMSCAKCLKIPGKQMERGHPFAVAVR